MSRILITDPLAKPPAPPVGDVLVITPYQGAAKAIGVPHVQLRKLAERAINRAGLRLATAVEARQLLKMAVRGTGAADDAAAYAGRINQILQTVIRTGIDPQKLIENGSPRVKVFGRVAEQYVRELRSRGLIDPEGLMHEAALIGPEKQRVVIYGYFRGRSEEVDFIDTLAADGSLYYLPCGDNDIFAVNRRWAAALTSRGWQTDGAAGTADGHTGRTAAAAFALGGTSAGCEAYGFADIDAETRFVLARAKELIAAGTQAEEIALVSPDPDAYTQAIAATAREFGLPVRFGHSIPLAETGIGRFTRLAFEAAASGFAFEPTARLLMHPLGPELKEDLWREARRRRTAGADWAELVPEFGCLEWAETATLKRREEELFGCFERFGVRAAAARSAREMHAYNKFWEALRESIKGSEEATFTQAAFAGLVYEILSAEKVRFDPGRAGIAVLDPKALSGAEIQHLFFIGMAEGVVPAPAADNPVIDFHERKRLSENGAVFEAAADVTRWEAAQFYFALLAGRQSITFTYPAVIENAEKIPSPFITMRGLEIRTETERPAASIAELRRIALRHAAPVDDAVLEAARRCFGIEMLREERPAATEYDGIIGRSVDAASRYWSVSQLTAIGQCSFRWFAAKMLKLAPPDEMADELDARTRGSLYHKVLEIAVARAMPQTDIRAAVLSNLEAAFDEAERDAALALPKVADWHLQKPDHLKTLRKAIESPDFIRPGTRVLAVEQGYEAEWCGLKMTGSIDRVDETPDGLIAIDYKTSSAPPKGIKDETGKLATDVQLPIYTDVALKGLYPDKQLGTGAYYSLTKGKILKEAGVESSGKLETFVHEMKQALAEGRFPVMPDVDGHACSYCDFTGMCRTGPRGERARQDG